VATTQVPLFGQSLVTSTVIARYPIGTLTAGSQTGAIDSGFLPLNRPSAGAYYLSMTLDENQSGSFFYFDLVQFIQLQAFGPGCISDPFTLCLNAGRFKVQATWSVPPQGTQGVGTAVALTSDTGYFWFFSSNNAEVMVKLLDGRALNNSFWFFSGALSNVSYSITVLDTLSGISRTYSNPYGSLASSADTNAFAGGIAPTATPTVPLFVPTPTPSPTPPPFNLTGTWSSTVSSPDGPQCSGAFNAVFVQTGSSFVGNFSIPLSSTSGSFIGNITGNSLSGVFNSTAGSCNGSGAFTGTASSNLVTISAPIVTSANPFCTFCQRNTIVLRR